MTSFYCAATIINMMTLNKYGVPYWIILLASVIALAGTATGLAELFSPGTLFETSGTELDSLSRSWGARNFAISATMGAAIYLQKKIGYIVAFTGAFFVGVGDIINSLVESDRQFIWFSLILFALNSTALWTLKDAITTED